MGKLLDVYKRQHTDREDMLHGTAACAAGGITTVILMPTNDPLVFTLEAFQKNLKAYENRAYVDYGIHGGLDAASFPHARKLWRESGITAIKVFMSYASANMGFVTDRTLYETLELASQEDAVVIIHCENDEIIKMNEDRMKAAGRTDRPVSYTHLDVYKRQPLTSIIGNSAAYLDNDKTLSRRDKHLLIQNIYDDSNWLLNMVENLLSVTRIHETGAQVTKSLEPLEEVISEAVRRFKKRLPNAHVNVTIPNDFIMIPMDATLIIQVILNLLENAVYHSQSDEPLNLVCSINDTHAQFEVIDHGVGIKEELLDTLFDGYVSTPNSNSDSHKGMGIGLSICKAIIVAHNGKIWAVNDGDGAHIIFILPLGEETYET